MTSLAAMTTREASASASAGALLAVPVGATEQHGPHLPLSTDTDIAVALAEGLARRRDDVVVAPPVAYGSSGEHAGFAGTLSIGQEATELLLVELVRSSPFACTVLVCAHGGNRAPVARAEQRLRREGRDVLAWFPRWGGDAHAGHVETSLMLALRPEQVRRERVEAGETAPVDTLLDDLVAAGVRSVSANGVLGDPRTATAEDGRALLERAVDDLVDRIGERAATSR